MLKRIKRYSFHWALGGNAYADMIEQNPQELILFCEFIKEHKINTFLEIGTQWGKLKEFLQKEMGLEVESIDIKDAPYVDYVGRSSLRKIINAVGNYDTIFVDAGHTYTSVKNDYNNYYLCKSFQKG